METKRYVLTHVSRKVHTPECVYVRVDALTVAHDTVRDAFPDYDDCKKCGGVGGM